TEVCVRPIADGGEGTVEALALGMNGHIETITASDPLGRPIDCSYGILADNQTAIIEMAAAAGLTLLSPDERNPLHTTTYGVGELIYDAISKGCRRFIIGIGGSATNDGGVGMLQALGYGILDKNGCQVPFGAAGLKEIERITDTSVIPELKQCYFRIACDVNNPLCGPNGCSAVFGPQKGADTDMIFQMDQWLKSYASICAQSFPHADAEFPGTGAAGGLGFAFLTFTHSVLESGIKIVLEETGLENYIQEADIVITGEGCLDAQTVMGKAPVGVARIAQKYNKPVIAFAGCVTEDATLCNAHGIHAFFPIIRRISTLNDAMLPDVAAQNLSDTAEQVFRLIHAIK
ncbi:MAG: glycerate kinase, partial [Lachnospiraceae bacterium]|nr:glycerate kinase [Lachnospiraceae bacterium]